MHTNGGAHPGGFGHERLDAYRASIDFFRIVVDLVRKVQPSDRALADQLHRAAASITLNIAEGAGEFSAKEKARFYRIALRSATECAAVLDLLAVSRGREIAARAPGRQILCRIVSMLTRMTQSTASRPRVPPKPPE
ncbi:MAG TPA: four helix bundle protein [Longimicrobiales bacterium]